MKSVFPLLVSLLLCSLAQGAACPNGQPKDEATLVQVENEWLRAVEQHDMAALGCILADEFEEADFAGSLIDRRAMLRSAPSAANDHYELADLHAHVYGDFAYVRGKGVSNANSVRTAKTRFTDIFVYREGRWQCVAGHESHFPEARPATY
jgi:ketosteroid isomerase-like protein